MYSIKFPDMFSGAKTNLIEDSTATLSNIKLLLTSWKKSLFGDPYFGTNLKKYIYEQNNIILRDIIIDDIFVSLQTFIPQISLKRSDIKISLNKTEIYATINCINKIDNQPNMFEIKLNTEDYIK